MASEKMRYLKNISRRDNIDDNDPNTNQNSIDARRAESLLSALIEEEKIDDYLIIEGSEVIIQSLTDDLYGQAEKLLHRKSFISSAEIVFAILVIIEHEMQYVHDEGFTFQCIIEDGFKLLKKIAAENYDQSTALKLISVAKDYNKRRTEDMRIYDDEWADAEEAFVN